MNGLVVDSHVHTALCATISLLAFKKTSSHEIVTAIRKVAFTSR